MNAQTQQIIMTIVTWAGLFAVFYFILIRPQKKKDKKLKEMRQSLSVGDKVTTIGGIIANVAKIEEDFVVLELGPNRTKVPFEKWAIGTVESNKESVE
ncbi:preprotein translocase subunit YajC [Romboutsia sedimentorum]|uniref:Preprotein translocase subunit YajC n=1 Tax=Romboutsia sedimentorum TaxID=1368474 RepID=A0ABT7ECP5_9FIRM|nr:preprotein translocase subunit YajC [Romboutsia sedimentorum]MDK2564688.1 preprotein translocase subunit YajC [Romboutsia sedimentorum]MDK2586396.1 preprotein translocase subunit YajC [Romboutsia sedimentorum]